jgi:hypothetical protein
MFDLSVKTYFRENKLGNSSFLYGFKSSMKSQKLLKRQKSFRSFFIHTHSCELKENKNSWLSESQLRHEFFRKQFSFAFQAGKPKFDEVFEWCTIP